MKNKLILAILIILAIVMALAVLGNYLPEIDAYLEQRRMTTIMDKLERQKAEREVRLRADFDGGKTPEETIQLLIAALERGDDVGASKYYELDAQEAAMRRFASENDAVGLGKSIEYFKEVLAKGKKTCETNKYETGCELNYEYVTAKDETVSVEGRPEKIVIPKGTLQEAGKSFILNPFTGIWKIK